MTTERKGLLAGLLAYTIWGLFPIYWRALAPAGPVELLGHRILWAAVAVGVILLVLRRFGEVGAALRNRRTALVMTGASIAICVNWGLFIWGVNNGYVIEVSLGYFINPLLSVVLGVVFFGERLRRGQWVALGIAVVAVVWLTIDYGRPPWIALALALSFGAYGALKKLTPMAPLPGLMVETLVLLPVAVLLLVLVGVQGHAEFGHHGWVNTTLILTVGLVTAGPLVLFAVAAKNIPLTTVGLLQYITPTLQLLCGVLLFGEHMTPSRWVGFGIVWLALAVFSADALADSRRARSERRAEARTERETVAVPPIT